MNRIRCAVIGVGYLGRFHAQKYAASPLAELVAVVDPDQAAADRVAAENGCEALSHHRELLGRVDAVSIAVPTTLHFELSSDFLRHGSHVLVEKPITSTLEEAETLVRLAREHGRLLQVGHLERFNPALMELTGQHIEPLFIESHRLAPFKPRATDVNVVLDLMIHDIDIILELVDSPLRSVQASGAQVLSRELDIVNARLEFMNGCVANVTSSRVSQKTERKMRIFQKNAYFSVDFQHRSLNMHVLDPHLDASGLPLIRSETREFAAGDALQLEIEAFLLAIRGEGPVVVSGEDGLRALRTAHDISRHLRQTVSASI